MSKTPVTRYSNAFVIEATNEDIDRPLQIVTGLNAEDSLTADDEYEITDRSSETLERSWVVNSYGPGGVCGLYRFANDADAKTWADSLESDGFATETKEMVANGPYWKNADSE